MKKLSIVSIAEYLKSKANQLPRLKSVGERAKNRCVTNVASLQLGAKEMAAVVKQMLNEAGLPVDLERTNLLERTLRLQDEVEKSAASLSAMEKVS